MKINLKTVEILLLLSASSYAGGDISAPVEPVVEVPHMVDTDKDYFVYAAGGFGVLDIDDSLASNRSFTDGTLDDKGGVFELGAGYRMNENIFVTIAAQRTMLDIADIDNFYASINYQLSDVTAKPYVGLLVGYSQLEWFERPHVMMFNEDLTSDGLMYGVQAGVEQELTDNWSVFAKYQFIACDHLMDIRADESTIEHNYAQNLLLGVQYAF